MLRAQREDGGPSEVKADTDETDEETDKRLSQGGGPQIDSRPSLEIDEF
jgi:hypothetical protein